MSSVLRGRGAGRALGFLQGERWSDGAAGGGEEVWGVVAREHGRLTGLWTHEVIVDMLMLGAGRRSMEEKDEEEEEEEEHGGEGGGQKWKEKST